jgi:protein SCO1
MPIISKKLVFILFLTFSICSYAEESTETNFTDSLWTLDHKWTDHKNKTISLSQLSGKPMLITMTFASCPGACPLMISDMKSIDRKLSIKEKSKIIFATFSIDPKRDTPEALKAFHKKMKLDKRWTLFTSDEDQAREMAAALGFSYKDLGDGDYTHSTSLYLVSSSGRILVRKERSQQWDELLEKLRDDLKSSRSN